MGLRDKLTEVAGIKDSPGKIAASFAVGVFFGMSPLLGLHTVLGLAAAWLFKLNKLVTIIGVYITNPWTIVPIYTFATWIGAKLLGFKRVIPDIDWHNISFTYLFKELEHLLWPFIVGTTVVGFVSAIVGYFVVYYAATGNRR